MGLRKAGKLWMRRPNQPAQDEGTVGLSDDPFRLCIYCGVDCIDYDTIEVPHKASCPIRTGLFPVTPRELRHHGMACLDCDHIFKLGESYMERQVRVNVFEVVCLSCGALEVLM